MTLRLYITVNMVPKSLSAYLQEEQKCEGFSDWSCVQRFWFLSLGCFFWSCPALYSLLGRFH